MESTWIHSKTLIVFYEVSRAVHTFLMGSHLQIVSAYL